jgi:RNase P subunit RPR2
MEIFEALPTPLKSNISQEVPASVSQRLNYLWKSSFALALSSITTSHLISRSFVNLVNKYAIELPSNIRYRICSYCSVLQLPSITCSVKVRRRGRQSRRNVNLIDDGNINR